MTPHETISMKIAELDAALKAEHPSMSGLLQLILRNLQADPEVVTLLKEEEVAQIVAGLSAQTSTQISQSMLSGGKGKALKKISADDI